MSEDTTPVVRPGGEILIYQAAEGELDEASTCRNFRQVRQEGRRSVAREVPFYNFDMIITGPPQPSAVTSPR